MNGDEKRPSRGTFVVAAIAALCDEQIELLTNQMEGGAEGPRAKALSDVIVASFEQGLRVGRDEERKRAER